MATWDRLLTFWNVYVHQWFLVACNTNSVSRRIKPDRTFYYNCCDKQGLDDRLPLLRWLCWAFIAIVWIIVVIAVSIEYKLCPSSYVILVSCLFWVSQYKHSLWPFTSTLESVWEQHSSQLPSCVCSTTILSSVLEFDFVTSCGSNYSAYWQFEWSY